MPEPDSVAALIDRIVAGAHIPGRAAREDLRRELWTHFEDAGTSPEALRQAVQRFGGEALVTESLRRVYRWDYVVLCLAKIAASVIASIGAALLIQIFVNLRVEVRAAVWRLAPGFSHAAVLSVGVVLALVALSAYAAVCLVVPRVFATSGGAFRTATILVTLGICAPSSRLGRPRCCSTSRCSPRPCT